MKQNEFLTELHEELDIESIKSLKLDTKFKDLEEWDSMTAMVLMGFINQNFNKNLSSEDLDKCETLFDVVKLKGLQFE